MAGNTFGYGYRIKNILVNIRSLRGRMFTDLLVLNFSIFLSLNLATFNLLPIPPLDGGKIHRYLIRLIGEHEAEDLTQEVFVKVSNGLKDFRGESQPSTWIYRIATNTALDRLRSPSFQQIAHKRSSNDPIEKEIEDKDIWTGEKTPSVDQQLVRKEMNMSVLGVLLKGFQQTTGLSLY